MSDRLRRLVVDERASIREAMLAIDKGAARIALVVRDDQLVGTLTDGDLRRALLSGAGMDDPVLAYLNRSPRVVGPHTPRAHALDVMRAWSIEQLPVLDDRGRLVGLHLLREIVGAEERPNAAVIMAGGRGTRLGAITKTVPKPLVEVAGRPILERIVLHLVGFGVRRIFISVNYLAPLIEEHFGDGDALGCSISYLREDPDLPLGTAGSLSLLDVSRAGIREPLIVMNGDVVSQFSVPDLLATHDHAGNLITVAVKEHVYQVPFGVVQGTDGQLTAWQEKPTHSWHVSAGIYVIAPQVVAQVPCATYCDVPTVVQRCAAAGQRIGTWSLDAEWLDVGRPSELQRARGEQNA